MQGFEIFVGAIIINTSGDFLLQKRDNNPIKFPRHWTLFGGNVEKDEASKKAILRELKEQISLQH